MKTPARSAGGLSLTLSALAALGAGLALGILIHGSTDPRVVELVDAIGAVGQLWVAALRMTVLPLMIGLTLVAIVGARRDDSIGALGVRALFVFIVMLVAAAFITLAVAAPIVSLYPVDAETAASFRAGTSIPSSPLESTRRDSTLGEWLIALIPGNVFQAAASGDILPILFFTVFFALAVTRLAPERSDPLREIFQAGTDAMMILIGWILKVLPLGVFALCVDFAFRVGVRLTGVIGVYVIIVSGMMLVVTALLYPATALLGRIPLSRFARAVAPAQLVAVSTRSSIASLPALVKGGQKYLALSASATGFLLPLSVTAFKLNRTISGPIKLMFLAHVFQVPLGVSQWAAFLVTQLILSFSTAGIPSVGTIRSIPAYLAAGVPIEGVVILDAVEAIPDIFKTLINVTADMSAVTILSRRDRVGPVAASEAAPPDSARAGEGAMAADKSSAEGMKRPSRDESSGVL